MKSPHNCDLALATALLVFIGTAVGTASFGTADARAESAPTDTTAEDFKSVQAVCSRCHGVALFMKQPRTWNRWNEVFIRMTGHGARPTEEQVDHIVRFFLANLTYVNVNTSPKDELGLALGVSDSVADEIIARRQKRKFRDVADLLSVPGVNAETVEQRKSRIQF